MHLPPTLRALRLQRKVDDKLARLADLLKTRDFSQPPSRFPTNVHNEWYHNQGHTEEAVPTVDGLLKGAHQLVEQSRKGASSYLRYGRTSASVAPAPPRYLDPLTYPAITPSAVDVSPSGSCVPGEWAVLPAQYRASPSNTTPRHSAQVQPPVSTPASQGEVQPPVLGESPDK